MKRYQQIGAVLFSGALLLSTTSCQPTNTVIENKKGPLEQMLNPKPEKKSFSESLLAPIIDAMIDHWLESASTRKNEAHQPPYQPHIIYGQHTIYEPMKDNSLRFYE